MAARQAEAQRAEAREAKAAAEQEARAAQEQLAAARQERVGAVTGPQSAGAEADSRAGQGVAEPTPADHAEAELQRPSAGGDKPAGQPGRRQPKSTTRRSRHPRKS
jgi:hypothetical protein